MKAINVNIFDIYSHSLLSVLGARKVRVVVEKFNETIKIFTSINLQLASW